MRQMGSFLAFYDAEGESLMFSIDGIGVLTISEEAMVQGEGPTGSISFTASESNLSEANEFSRQLRPQIGSDWNLCIGANSLRRFYNYQGAPNRVPTKISPSRETRRTAM